MELRFEVIFHGPMRVGTGVAARGADDTVDVDRPLPGTSLKGLMRDVATSLFGVERTRRVFGGEGQECVWGWTDTEFGSVPAVRRRTRIAIGSAGVVESGALVVQEEIWPETATFSIEQIAPLKREERAFHERVLTASAHGVHSVGAERRRGLGWVGIRRTGVDVRLQEILASAVELACLGGDDQ